MVFGLSYYSHSTRQQDAVLRRNRNSVWRDCEQRRVLVRLEDLRMGEADDVRRKTVASLRSGQSIEKHHKYSEMQVHCCVIPFQAMLLLDKMLYVSGGTSGWVFNMHIYCLNLQTRTWKRLHSNNKDYSQIPLSRFVIYLKQWQYVFFFTCIKTVCRYRHEMGAFDDKLYVFGGGTVHEVYGMSEVSSYLLYHAVFGKLQLCAIFCRFLCSI